MIFFGCSYVLVGKNALEAWIGLFLQSHDVLSPATIGNQSIYGALFRHIDTPKIYFIGLFLVSSLIFIKSWHKKNWDTFYGFSTLTALLPIFGILTWKNTYVFWCIPFAYFIKKYGYKAVLPCAVLFQVLSQGIIGKSLNAISLSYGFLPLIALVFIFYWMIKTLRAPPQP